MTKRDALALLRLPAPLPPWRVGARVLATVDDWDDVIASHYEDDFLPALVAFSHSPTFLDLTDLGRRHRLAIEAADLPPRPTEPTARARSFMESAAAITYGDLVVASLGRTLARLPWQVAEHFCRPSTVVFAAGVESKAWTARLRLPVDPVVVTLATDEPGAIAHEASHVFYDFDRDRPPPEDLTALAVARARHHATARAEAEGSVEDRAVLLHVADADHRAELLARVWTEGRGHDA